MKGHNEHGLPTFAWLVFKQSDPEVICLPSHHIWDSFCISEVPCAILLLGILIISEEMKPKGAKQGPAQPCISSGVTLAENSCEMPKRTRLRACCPEVGKMGWLGWVVGELGPTGHRCHTLIQFFSGQRHSCLFRVARFIGILRKAFSFRNQEK